MKKLIASLVFITCVLSANSQNSIFAASRNDDMLYCIRFKDNISFIIDLDTPVKKYSDFGNSVLLSNESKIFIFGLSPFQSFLDKKSMKKKIEVRDIILKYYKWEKEYQEKENGYIFTDDIEIYSDDSGKLYGHYTYSSNKPIKELKDTETVFTEGYLFVYKNYIVYINAPIIKIENIEEIQNILKNAVSKLKVTDQVFEEKDL